MARTVIFPRVRQSIWITACAALIFAANAASAATDQEIGYVSKMAYQGAIGIRVGGQRRQLIPTRTVYSNETVLTGSLQETTLRFHDNTKLQVGRESRIKLDKFVYDPDRRTGDFVLSLVKGGLRFISGKMRNKEGYRILTPVAAISVRGTDFKAFYSAAGLVVSVREGSVEIVPLQAGGGAIVGAGQSASVASAGASVAVVSGDAVGPRPALQDNPY